MKGIFRLVLAALLIMALPAAACLAEGQGTEKAGKTRSQELVERLVISYGAYGERDTPAEEALAAEDPELAEKWGRIMDVWETDVPVNPELPDGLPEDDSLCLVVLGYQLNPDGTMRKELVQRLKVALAAAEKYPNAMIACTGGPTATDNRRVTEAGRMVKWLERQGIDPERFIAEDASKSTAQNAMYTLGILAEQYPRVKQIAIISSDYHIATGVLLFTAEAILRDLPVAVVTNAAWDAPRGSLSAMFQAGALIELSGDRETAVEIYNSRYSLRSLPPLE